MISPELLRRYPYFTSGGEEALEKIAMIADEVDVAGGAVIFREGDQAERIFVIIEGQVYIQLPLRDGKTVVVDTMVAGDLVGWSALATPRTRRATCTARQATKLIRIDGAGLRALCDENAELGYRIMRELVRALTYRLDGAWVQLAAAYAE